MEGIQGMMERMLQSRKTGKIPRHSPVAYGLIAPSFTLMLTFSYFPVIVAIVYSFTTWDGFNPPQYSGLANYQQVLSDPIFWLSMWHLLLWGLFKLFVDLAVPLVTASLIFHLRSSRAQYVYRVLFVIPMVVPGVVLLMIWSFLYDPNLGVINSLIHHLGFTSLTPDWLGDPNLALIALMLVGLPFVIPFNLLIFYAGLQHVSESVFEAATLDGCSALSRFFKIEFPLLLGQTKLLMILTVIGLLQNVMGPLVLTNGGPGYATYMPALMMYFDAFQNNQMSLGLAIAMIIFVMVLVLTWAQNKFIRPSEEFVN